MPVTGSYTVDVLSDVMRSYQYLLHVNTKQAIADVCDYGCKVTTAVKCPEIYLNIWMKFPSGNINDSLGSIGTCP